MVRNGQKWARRNSENFLSRINCASFCKRVFSFCSLAKTWAKSQDGQNDGGVERLVEYIMRRKSRRWERGCFESGRSCGDGGGYGGGSGDSEVVVGGDGADQRVGWKVIA